MKENKRFFPSINGSIDPNESFGSYVCLLFYFFVVFLFPFMFVREIIHQAIESLPTKKLYVFRNLISTCFLFKRVYIFSLCHLKRLANCLKNNVDMERKIISYKFY